MYKKIILEPILEQKRRLYVMFAALVVLSASQALFLFLIKTFVELLFKTQDYFSIQDIAGPVVGRLLRLSAAPDISHASLCVVIPAVILCAGLGRAFGLYLFQLNQQAVALRVAQHCRNHFFAKLLNLPYLEIAKKSSGEWMSRIMNDVLIVQMRLSDILTALVKDSVIVITAYVCLLVIHWPTALLLLVLCPPLTLGMARIGRIITYYADQVQNRLGAMAAKILDVRNRFDFIRSQSGEALEEGEFAKINDSFFRMISKSIFIRSAFAPGLEFVGFMIFAGFVYAIGAKATWLDMEPGALMVFFAALGLMLKPLRNFGEQISRFSETKGSLQRSIEAFSSAAQLDHSASGGVFKEGQPAGGLNSQDDSSQDAGSFGIHIASLRAGTDFDLQARDLDIRSGESIAIVGPSGAGKSTLIKTFAGLIPPAAWQADRDWREFSAQTSYISQHPFLFDATIRENLSYGNDQMHNASNIADALGAVNMNREIAGFADGVETHVKALDSNLSGGQIQRLVIARGVLRDKSVLLLDEATSALDAKNEEIILKYFLDQCAVANKSLIAITHRLRWLHLFRRIWFVEDGRIKFSGSHDELLENQRYREFCHAQHA